MKTIIILAHPNIEQSIINKTWIEALAKSNPEVTVHDIYKAYPDWNIDVIAEQVELEKYDRIVFQYPLYWYAIPPLLKKWLDEVFAYGWAYGSAGGVLEGKDIRLAVSTGGVEEAYTESSYGTMAQILKPMESTAHFVKAKYGSFHVFHGALSPDAKDRLSANVKEYIDFVSK